MPSSQKNTGQSKTPTFEEALKRLEQIVESLESDELPLETLIARYEEGMKLVRVCQAKLAEAELKIQQLEKAASGEFRLKPFELTDESSANP